MISNVHELDKYAALHDDKDRGDDNADHDGRGNRSLALSNMSRSLQRFLMVHTKQHRFVESFKRSDIQLRIISIHCDVLPKNVCLAFWQK